MMTAGRSVWKKNKIDLLEKKARNVERYGPFLYLQI